MILPPPAIDSYEPVQSWQPEQRLSRISLMVAKPLFAGIAAAVSAKIPGAMPRNAVRLATTSPERKNVLHKTMGAGYHGSAHKSNRAAGVTGAPSLHGEVSTLLEIQGQRRLADFVRQLDGGGAVKAECAFPAGKDFPDVLRETAGAERAHNRDARSARFADDLRAFSRDELFAIHGKLVPELCECELRPSLVGELDRKAHRHRYVDVRRVDDRLSG